MLPEYSFDISNRYDMTDGTGSGLPATTTDMDSMFSFLPTSPMMSLESLEPLKTDAPAPTCKAKGKGTLYAALHAAHSQQQPAAPPNPHLSLFDMAASPTLSPMLLLSPTQASGGSQGSFMFKRGPMDDFCLSPGLDGFLMGGLSADSPRQGMLSPPMAGRGRVTKVPMRRNRGSPRTAYSPYPASQKSPHHHSPKQQLSPRHYPAINHQPPTFMMLPCQVDPKTNKTSPHPGCPEVLSPSSGSPSCLQPPPMMHPAFFLQPQNHNSWLADFAAHRAAFLQDYQQLDFANVTVVELKTVLRRYGIARAGKKGELEERVKQIAIFLQTQIKKEEDLQKGESDGNLDEKQQPELDRQKNQQQQEHETALDEQAIRDASLYINA